MPTLGKFNGDLLVLKSDGTVISHSQDATLTIGVNLPDATTKDSGAWEEHIKGNRNWTMTATGLVTFDGTLAPDAIALQIINQDDVTLEFTTDVTGDKYYTGTGSLESFTENAPQNAPASFDCSYKGNGPLSIATVA